MRHGEGGRKLRGLAGRDEGKGWKEIRRNGGGEEGRRDGGRYGGKEGRNEGRERGRERGRDGREGRRKEER